ncbi:alpha/beta fold hydrolase [Siccirubricoccus sp. G192]|uniref:alpha/beta fold hydrolase n=1 Tax=Siccirubricoccus sp. G192 TaxID=2849651 RepID=UPI001C2CA7B1|nr:alpha/beta hydrolase [Siccirubricoccus sp. G192]
MQPRQRRFSARDGLVLAALDWAGPPGGEGRTPLLCLPGIARTALDFTGVALRHRHHRRVVALDYAGHGESGRAADPARYRTETTLRDLLDAMAALHLHRVALLGTSFGGMLGMALGVLRPGCLAGLALNDTGPRLEPGGGSNSCANSSGATLPSAVSRRPLPSSAAPCPRSASRSPAGGRWPRPPMRAARMGAGIPAGTPASSRAWRHPPPNLPNPGPCSARWRRCRCCCSGARRAPCSRPRRWPGCARRGRTWRWSRCPASAMRRH